MELLHRRLELVRGLLEVLLETSLFRHVEERDRHADRLAARHDRHHLHLQRTDLSRGLHPPDLADRRSPAGLDHFFDPRSQFDGTIGELQFPERSPDGVWGDMKLGASRLVGQDQRSVAVYHDLRDAERLECRFDAGLATSSLRSAAGEDRVDRRSISPLVLLGLHEDPTLEIDGRERRHLREEQLRLPQHEISTRIECEAETVHHLGLSFGVHIHEGIAAGEQVDPGERRILNHVVAAEDDRATQFPVEDITVGRFIEVLLAKLRRDRIHVLGRIRRDSSLSQRVLVDVRPVHLHLTEEGL